MYTNSHERNPSWRSSRKKFQPSGRCRAALTKTQRILFVLGWDGTSGDSIALAITAFLRIASDIARNFRNEREVWPSAIADSEGIATTNIASPQKTATYAQEKMAAYTFTT